MTTKNQVKNEIKCKTNNRKQRIKVKDISAIIKETKVHEYVPY